MIVIVDVNYSSIGTIGKNFVTQATHLQQIKKKKWKLTHRQKANCLTVKQFLNQKRHPSMHKSKKKVSAKKKRKKTKNTSNEPAG